ncbi:MAG: hypothetical protein ABSG87_07370 [Verrucomicrobiota bacterium]
MRLIQRHLARRFQSVIQHIANNGAAGINHPVLQNDFELVKCLGKSRNNIGAMQFKKNDVARDVHKHAAQFQFVSSLERHEIFLHAGMIGSRLALRLFYKRLKMLAVVAVSVIFRDMTHFWDNG